MKLLFISPNWKWCEEEKNVNYPFPPYNLCLLAAIIRNQKLATDIKIVDAYVDDLNILQVKKIIEEYKPDVMGTTVLMDQLCDAGHMVTKITKEVNPNTITVLGGVYATMNPNRAVADENLDYVVVGEGEYVFPAMMKYFQGKEKELPTKGIMFKKDGKIIFNGRSDFVTDMDSLPIPAWDLIDFPAYSDHVAREFSPDSPRDLPYVRLYTSRGCPFTCSFCQVPKIAGHVVRRQSAKRVIDELELITKKFGIKSFMNSDDNFLATGKENLREFLHGLRDRKLGLTWIFEDVGVMHLTKEKIDWLADSGCNYMGFAVETGVERISKDLIAGKPLKKQHSIEMMEYAKSKGIFCSANFIVGFPTETWDEIRETIAFAEKLNADYTRIHILVPLKGTRMFEMVENEGLLNERYDHFNQKATWKAGTIESRNYTSNDLTILKAMEWDRLNFTDPKKREKICKWLRVTEQELLDRRRKTIESIYKNLNDTTKPGVYKDKDRKETFGATFERVDGPLT
tara:strand:- start:8066 stop:9604 length:1539 start_codon:yes stop_codon:yes gene_type:complete